MTEFAWSGVKSCGCRTFARLCAYKPNGKQAAWPKGVKVEKVPVERAHVHICKCAA